MAYWLGVDIGTTFTAAAVWRDSQVEVATLGTRAPVVPTLVFVRPGGEVLVGEAAERRAMGEPGGVAREFKRRVGDSEPIVLADAPHSPEDLMARVLRWVVGQVTEREGGPPAGVTVSYPASWGRHKRELLDRTVRLADVGVRARDLHTVTEPEAAAIFYASQERVAVGARILVYDLGGGTFDAAVLRKMGDGWVVLGAPQGVEHLGGVDVDEAVLRHVAASVGDGMTDLDPDDRATVVAMARLRRDCVEAKEALSSDTDVVIQVLLPGVQAVVRLTRAELEDMIRPTLATSIGALERAVRSAGLEPAQLDVVLLAGGSSRIPLVAQMVGSELRRPVAVDAHPEHGVALGAAILAARTTARATAPPRRVLAPALALAQAQARARARAGGVGGVRAGCRPGPAPRAAHCTITGVRS